MTRSVAARYSKLRSATLVEIAARLESYTRRSLQAVQRVDRISARAKAVDRFVGKAKQIIDGAPKYTDPFSQIQDQVGVRVVVLYLSDIPSVSVEVERYFRPIEKRVIVPDSEAEFGYFGKHYIMLIPTDCYDSKIKVGSGPRFFELQIKTLFQHAWSEADHDLGYKPSTQLSSDQKRRIAFTAAQAWGADTIFDELHGDLNKKVK